MDVRESPAPIVHQVIGHLPEHCSLTNFIEMEDKYLPRPRKRFSSTEILSPGTKKQCLLENAVMKTLDNIELTLSQLENNSVEDPKLAMENKIHHESTVTSLNNGSYNNFDDCKNVIKPDVKSGQEDGKIEDNDNTETRARENVNSIKSLIGNQDKMLSPRRISLRINEKECLTVALIVEKHWYCERCNEKMQFIFVQLRWCYATFVLVCLSCKYLVPFSSVRMNHQSEDFCSGQFVTVKAEYEKDICESSFDERDCNDCKKKMNYVGIKDNLQHEEFNIHVNICWKCEYMIIMHTDYTQKMSALPRGIVNINDSHSTIETEDDQISRTDDTFSERSVEPDEELMSNTPEFTSHDSYSQNSFESDEEQMTNSLECTAYDTYSQSSVEPDEQMSNPPTPTTNYYNSEIQVDIDDDQISYLFQLPDDELRATLLKLPTDDKYPQNIVNTREGQMSDLGISHDTYSQNSVESDEDQMTNSLEFTAHDTYSQSSVEPDEEQMSNPPTITVNIYSESSKGTIGNEITSLLQSTTVFGTDLPQS